jgi:hypothetical protein
MQLEEGQTIIYLTTVVLLLQSQNVFFRFLPPPSCKSDRKSVTIPSEVLWPDRP